MHQTLILPSLCIAAPSPAFSLPGMSFSQVHLKNTHSTPAPSIVSGTVEKWINICSMNKSHKIKFIPLSPSPPPPPTFPVPSPFPLSLAMPDFQRQKNNLFSPVNYNRHYEWHRTLVFSKHLVKVKNKLIRKGIIFILIMSLRFWKMTKNFVNHPGRLSNSPSHPGPGKPPFLSWIWAVRPQPSWAWRKGTHFITSKCMFSDLSEMEMHFSFFNDAYNDGEVAYKAMSFDLINYVISHNWKV